MNRSQSLLILLVGIVLAACKPSPETPIKAIIGAVLIDGTGGAPVSDSVVLITGARIRAAGLRANVPIPAGSEKVNGAGKFVVPALIDLDGGAPERGVIAVQSHVRLKIPQVSSVDEVKRLLESGADAFLGMIDDTEEIEPAFFRLLRDLQIVFAPRLALRQNAPEALSRAMRNTKRLSEAGVAIGVASGSHTHREILLLAEAGLSPMEVIVAATRNGALALKQTDKLGAIEPGKKANLLLIGANPLEDIRNLRKLERVMINGQWVDSLTH
jgi:imidazolonepropionase-like amidohydrolase